MESKFSIQKLNRRVKKYIWQPSTEEGNPLYSKGIDNEGKPIINQDIVFGEDKEFKNIINSKFSSPNNIRALFLFDNLGITVLHHGLGNDIKIKADGGYDIKYGDSGLVLYSKEVGAKNLIKIGKGKDQAPDKLMFGTVSGETTDNQGNSTENFEYEEINAITDTHKMPIAMLNKWQMLNIEELYFDIMYTLNDLKGKVGDKKIDINEVVKIIFKVNDVNEINNTYPRLKYIGFVNHSKELNELIKDRSRGENGKGLIAQVEKVQQNKEKSIIEQIPVLLGSLDRTNTLELKGNTTGKYGYNIKDWAYDYVFIKCNEKAEQKENKIQKQQEEDNVAGYKDITEKFMTYWNGKTFKKGIFTRKKTQSKISMSVNGQEYPIQLWDVKQIGSKGLMVIEEYGVSKLEKIGYLYDNYNFVKGDTRTVIDTKDDYVKYAVIQIPQELKAYIRRNGFVYKLNFKDKQEGDYIVCRLVNGEPEANNVWCEFGTWFNEYYEKVVKSDLPDYLEPTKKYIVEMINNTEKNDIEKNNLIVGMITMNVIAPQEDKEKIKKDIEILLYDCYISKILNDNATSNIAVATISVLKKVNKYCGDISIKDYFNKGE